MPLFIVIALAIGAILIGATAADGRWWHSSQTAMTGSFDASQYRTTPGCL